MDYEIELMKLFSYIISYVWYCGVICFFFKFNYKYIKVIYIYFLIFDIMHQNILKTYDKYNKNIF